MLHHNAKRLIIGMFSKHLSWLLDMADEELRNFVDISIIVLHFVFSVKLHVIWVFNYDSQFILVPTCVAGFAIPA